MVPHQRGCSISASDTVRFPNLISSQFGNLTNSDRIDRILMIILTKTPSVGYFNWVGVNGGGICEVTNQLYHVVCPMLVQTPKFPFQANMFSIQSGETHVHIEAVWPLQDKAKSFAKKKIYLQSARRAVLCQEPMFPVGTWWGKTKVETRPWMSTLGHFLVGVWLAAGREGGRMEICNPRKSKT